MNAHAEPKVSVEKPLELWRQDPTDADLWHHESKLIVNTAALIERGSYVDLLLVCGTTEETRNAVLEAVALTDTETAFVKAREQATKGL